MLSRLYFIFSILILACGSETDDPIISMPTLPDSDPVVTKHIVPDDFNTIQEAYDNATTGDTIVVKPGEYFININANGKNVFLTSQFYESNDISFIQNTILNGSQGTSENGSVFLFTNNVGARFVVQGFTITGGTGTIYTSSTSGNVTRGGGGIMIQNGSDPTIRYNIIENNESIDTDGPNAVAGGGGIRMEQSTAKIANNIIQNNSAGFGGGIFVDQSASTLTNNVIAYNEATEIDFAGGGGLYFDFTLEQGSGNKVINNTIYNNSSAGTSDGVTFAGPSVFDRLVFENNIVYAHEKNSIFIRNGASEDGFSPAYSLIEGGWNNGSHILDADPEVDSENFSLSSSSPCIDSGNPSSSFNDTGMYSQGTERNDLGAFGGPLSFRIL